MLPLCYNRPSDFYPRSPCGERPKRYLPCCTSRIFLSTLSLRRATSDCRTWTYERLISIHALLAESDGAVLELQCILGDFYPRSPCGERLSQSSEKSTPEISIHALLAESDESQRLCARPTTDFYPRSPCGERQGSTARANVQHHFYPRSPCGERRSDIEHHHGLKSISIHALLAESDNTADQEARKRLISIHALLAESDCITTITTCTALKFLSTLSLRRATPPARY